jgi:APA family basic amino acid/polyamine antiporter
VPLVPILSIVSAFYLMFSLPALTWEVVGVWLVIGLCIYFTYSVRNSKVQKSVEQTTE